MIVNRVWKHLFGRGIVSTVDNFGTTGDPPSNPALLDHLAARFVREGWSIKRLVRSVVLSRAYGLSSEVDPAHLAADPADRLVWRHEPRRLDAEEIRDAMLATAGSLSRDRPAGSAAQKLKMIEMRDNGPEARAIHERADSSHYRSVYLPLLRGITPHTLGAFDPVEQTLVTDERETHQGLIDRCAVRRPAGRRASDRRGGKCGQGNHELRGMDCRNFTREITRFTQDISRRPLVYHGYGGSAVPDRDDRSGNAALSPFGTRDASCQVLARRHERPRPNG